MIELRCAGCGAAVAPEEARPYRCPNAGRHDDTDHVLAMVLDPRGIRFPSAAAGNPFVAYRELTLSWHLAHAHGLPDRDHVALVEDLDRAVAAVDGRGFRVTPFGRSAPLGDALGVDAVFVKDETGNVSGSHKARHLMGVMIHLQVAERLGLAPAPGPDGLAIASCGNAALAAAVVARAAGRPLRVFIPPHADSAVVGRLSALGARLVACPRRSGERGDPCFLLFREAVARGALPFTCQGSENGLAIEGGKTLAYEIVSALESRGLDRVFVQVGGGALASACAQGFAEAVALGALPRAPRLHAVQTANAHPLKRAWDRLAGRAGEEDLRHAATHRSEFMRPWEEEPRSIATGILDDETYDWLAVVRGMVATGGHPVLVSEETLKEANDLARTTTGIDVDPTGSAGLAGLIELRRQGVVDRSENVAVLFTGVRR